MRNTAPAPPGAPRGRGHPHPGRGLRLRLHHLARAAARDQINAFTRDNGGAFDAWVDFDAAVRNPADPEAMLPQYDCGDHLHPNGAGYQAMADAIDLDRL